MNDSAVIEGGVKRFSKSNTAVISMLINIIPKPWQVLVALLMFSLFSAVTAQSAYKSEAKQAAAWISTNAIRSQTGTTWPADPADLKTVSRDLYSGSAGIVLFLLEVHRSTGSARYLSDAKSGADHLLASLDKEKGTGLYDGLAGIGFVLLEVYKTTGQIKYRRGALQCVHLINERAQKAGRGIEWNDVSDIISGGAGTGLFLLYAARELGEESAREVAIKAGHRMIELSLPENGGLKWAMSSTHKALMPNFSHGTAGVAYFLATLYRETKRKEFLDTALLGAKYLQSVAEKSDEASLIFHHEPDGKDLYYLGWCHGPAGTARLYYQLYQITGKTGWMDEVKKSAKAILNSGIPEKRTPGFWNNVSICCGTAGIAKFFLGLYRAVGDRQYLAFSKRMTADLLARSSVEGKGRKWVQAEHRVKPDLLVAQTGYMQGAAGIGSWLLELHSFGHGNHRAIRFPDDPF